MLVVDSGYLIGVALTQDLERAPPGALACECASSPSVRLGSSTSIGEAARLMGETRSTCLPVMAGGLLLGVVTAADLERHLRQQPASGR